MEIGERIRRRREELDMTQDELARAAGYKSRSSINKIEMDGRGLPQKKVADIARALNALETHECVKNTHACVLPLFSHPKMWYNMDTSLRVEILRKKNADGSHLKHAVCFFRASEKAVGSRLFFLDRCV